jgi:small GTP-binding protein
MIKRKICMLGAFAVGKTSLVGRFVNSIYSEKYHTTIGVKIDKKTVEVDGEDVVLLIWDIYGEDDIQEIRLNYIRGSAGYLLIADGTRPDTLETARHINKRIERTLGKIPFVFLINKSDLRKDWSIESGALDKLRDEGWEIMLSSAKAGDGVEEGFTRLAQMVAQE